MATLDSLLSSGRQIRAIGFDDGPHQPGDTDVPIAGILCRDAILEGMVWTTTPRDGLVAGRRIAERLTTSRFHVQAQVVLLDGITMAGLDVVDLEALHAAVALPVIAALRRAPNLPRFFAALDKVPDTALRRARRDRAGPLHEVGDRVFHCVGVAPAVAAGVLDRFCVHGHVPEPLRLAHQITGAVVTGESSRRA